ncbi:MAG: hypothetical protein QG624_250, partial [Pseudomonadota bacterium]|nr:hypothetical protein [Pseudomonadota bacterium]
DVQALLISSSSSVTLQFCRSLLSSILANLTFFAGTTVEIASIDESNDLQNCNVTDEELEISNA